MDEPRLVLPSAELSLQVDRELRTVTTDGEDPPGQTASARLSQHRSWRTGSTVFKVGAIGMVGGVGAMGVGAVGSIAGLMLYGASLGQEGEGILDFSGNALLAGFGTTLLALPVMSVGGLIANKGLRAEGVRASSIPGWVSVGGGGLLITGVIVGGDTGIGLGGIGATTLVIGSIWQVAGHRLSFRRYKRSLDQETTLHVVPVLEPQAPGLALALRW